MLKNFDEVQNQVRSIQEPFTISVAAANDSELLHAVKLAADMGFVRPVLTGDTKAISALAKKALIRMRTSRKSNCKKMSCPVGGSSIEKILLIIYSI